MSEEKYVEMLEDGTLYDYITNLQEELKEAADLCSKHFVKIQALKEELKSANESITWWQNRFNALQEENKKLKQWDCNKDTRNSRQRVANKKLLEENKILKENYEKEHYLVDKLTRQLNDEYKNTEYQCKQKENYKSRCEKALDVLEELIAEFQLNDYITYFDKKMNKPLNILQGSDKE